MNWKNLKENKCPTCNKALKTQGVYLKCKCGFIISLSKFNETIRRLYYQNEAHHYRNISEEENLERLNNL